MAWPQRNQRIASSGTTAVLVLNLLAYAAAASDSAIDRCRAEGSSAARIACLEAALSAESEHVELPREESPAESAVAAEAASLPEDIGREVAKGVESQSIPPVAGESAMTDEQAFSQESPQADLQRQDVVPVGSEESGLGAEQIRTIEEANAELAYASGLAVKGYARVPYKRLEITLANGQVWRQINGDTQEIRATLRKNQTVDIEESSLGGYKLRLNEMRRTIRVRRIK